MSVPIDKYEWDGLASTPFVMMVHARRGSGKTYFVRHLCQHFLGDDVAYVVFSSTAYDDGEYRSFLPPKRTHFEEAYDPEVLSSLIDLQASAKQKGKKIPHTVVILDDVLYDKVSTDPVLVRAACMGRHVNLSLILVTQAIVGVTTRIRSNLTHFVTFACDSLNQDRLIPLMLSGVTTRELALPDTASRRERIDRCVAVYHAATDEEYTALVLDLSPRPLHGKRIWYYLVED